MSDSFDMELRKALKESAARELEGWEFTPAMRQKVLDRIRAEEEADSDSTPAPVRRLRPAQLLRPAAWLAVAAAAVVVAVKMDFSGMMGESRQEAASVADQEFAWVMGAEESARQGAPRLSQVPPKENLKPVGQGAAEETKVNALTVAPPDRADAGMFARTQPAEIPLVLPPEIKSLNADLDATGLSVDASDPSGDPTARKLAVMLTDAGVRAIGPDAQQVWFQPLPDGVRDAYLAVAADGRVVLAAGAKVFMMNADGGVEQEMDLAGPVTAIAVGMEDRLAVANGRTVEVYDRSGLQFAVPEPGAPVLALGSSGRLAALSGDGDERRLRVYDPKGELLMTFRPTGQGNGLAFAGDGVVVAGREAYYLNGRPAYQISVDARGLLAVDGGDYLLAWDGQTAALFRAKDGYEAWRAVLKHPGILTHAAVSPDGQHVALAATHDKGGALWVITRSGELRHAERLPAAPRGAAYAGDQLILLLPDGPYAPTINR